VGWVFAVTRRGISTFGYRMRIDQGKVVPVKPHSPNRRLARSLVALARSAPTRRDSIRMGGRLREWGLALGLALALASAWGRWALAGGAWEAAASRTFRAGAFALDINPPRLPVHVLGMFTDRQANQVQDDLFARCLVLDDGTERLALVLVDSCMMPRDLVDEAKTLAAQQTGIRPERMLISATHTHSAPAAMPGLGTPADVEYARFLRGRIAEGIAGAARRLEPARIGWTVIAAPEHTHTRRWIYRPDRLLTDPFGERSVRANMHPGYVNPDAIEPAGPSDPDITVLAVQSRRGRPLALFANYSMHYYDSPMLSADYFGKFAARLTELIGPGPEPASASDSGAPGAAQAVSEAKAEAAGLEASRAGPWVAMMSQGTSGDQMWMDYGRPANPPGLVAYAEAIAQRVHTAYQSIRYHEWVPLGMREARLKLRFRLCDEGRLAWAQRLVGEMNGRLPRNLPEVYAYEQVYLHARPEAELILQAVRIGELGITACPNEVYAITGLKLKTQSPFEATCNVTLANGSEGYIPPPEQHLLGGYTTWAARTAGLEVGAEPKIVETLLTLLEGVAGRPRRSPEATYGPYARAILEAQPAHYWRLEEYNGPSAQDWTGAGRPARYEGGVAFRLPGPAGRGFAEATTAPGAVNAAVHFAGGRLEAVTGALSGEYSVELWFWNGLPSDARGIAGWLFTRDGRAFVEGLGLGGTRGPAGRLFYTTGRSAAPAQLMGRTELSVKTWYHVVLVRAGPRVTVYLDGEAEPECAGEVPLEDPFEVSALLFGGSADGAANLAGKLDEIAVYPRALAPEEIAAHYRAAFADAPVAGEPSGRLVVYQGLATNECLRRWLVLGPVPTRSREADEADEAAQRQAFATDYLSGCGGEAGVEPAAGARVQIGGETYTWRLLESGSDVIRLPSGGAPRDDAVAYAAAEIRTREARRVVLGVGSDDGVKVWLNGRLVHEHWVLRGVTQDTDLVAVDLAPGANRLLLKIQNARGEWGFTCRPLGVGVLGRRLVEAARGGDLAAVKLALESGADLEARRHGLTAWQVARIARDEETAAWLASQGAVTNAPLPAPETVLAARLEEATAGESAGVAVLVGWGGRIEFERGYGYANLEHRVPVTPQTKFRIGSITKQFTAAGILRLREQGKLDLSDMLAKYLPDYPRGGEVNLEHLLTHTSGIHSYTSKPDFMASVSVPVKPAALIESFKHDPYDFAPGAKRLYNNSGYFLLGYLLEQVSGRTYAQFMQDTFFEPLGMRHTGVHEATAILRHEATGYSHAGGEWRKALDWDMSRAGGAGALYSTVRDLFLWNEALFNGQVLSEVSLQAAFTPVVTRAEGDDPAPKETGYGYGWALGRVGGLETIDHGGGLHGFVSYLQRFPAQQFTVVVLANASDPPPALLPSALAREIAQLYLWREMKPRETPKVARSVDPATYEAFVGRYDYSGAVAVVTREGDRLFVQVSGQPRHEVFPKSADTFFWKVVEAEVQFVKNEQGDVVKAIHRQGGHSLHAPRVVDTPEVRLAPEVLDSYVGRYDYGSGLAILTVTREGDRLYAQLTGQPKFQIFAQSETEFFWKVAVARVSFVKDAAGKVTKLVHRQGDREFEAPKLE